MNKIKNDRKKTTNSMKENEQTKLKTEKKADKKIKKKGIDQ